jgi:hypothetical protein
MWAIHMKLVVLNVYSTQNVTETKLVSATSVGTHALEHVDRMLDVMLSTTFQHAHVLQDSLEILSQIVDKPFQVGFILVYMLEDDVCL